MCARTVGPLRSIPGAAIGTGIVPRIGGGADRSSGGSHSGSASRSSCVTANALTRSGSCSERVGSCCTRTCTHRVPVYHVRNISGLPEQAA